MIRKVRSSLDRYLLQLLRTPGPRPDLMLVALIHAVISTCTIRRGAAGDPLEMPTRQFGDWKEGGPRRARLARSASCRSLVSFSPRPVGSREGRVALAIFFLPFSNPRQRQHETKARGGLFLCAIPPHTTTARDGMSGEINACRASCRHRCGIKACACYSAIFPRRRSKKVHGTGRMEYDQGTHHEWRRGEVRSARSLGPFLKASD